MPKHIISFVATPDTEIEKFFPEVRPMPSAEQLLEKYVWPHEGYKYFLSCREMDCVAVHMFLPGPRFS